MPVLWVTGTNDFAYPMDSLQKSYRLPPGGRTLCVKVRMPHGHNGPGEKPEEIRALADALLRGGEPLAKVTGQGRDDDAAGGGLWATYEAEVPLARAELVFTRDGGEWQKRNWETAPAQVNAPSRKVTARPPPGTTVCYLNLIDERGLVVSTEHEEVAPK